MILDRLGILNWEVYSFLLSWKTLIIGVGAFVFASKNRESGLIIIALGLFLMLPDIFEDYEVIRKFFWPVIIFVIGFLLVVEPYRNKKRLQKNLQSDEAASSGDPFSMSYFDEFVVFGGRDVYITSKDFKGGRSVAIFGGSEVDLLSAMPSVNGAEINITALFGGQVIYVPSDWTVVNQVTAIFGGANDIRKKDTSYNPSPNKVVRLTGVCMFGGVEIRLQRKEK